MRFPETHATLIARLASGGSDDDWRAFLMDYWGPLVRFAVRAAGVSAADADDVAAETLLLVVRGSLLARWREQPTVKLRSYLCGVVRNLLANRRRVAQGRQRVLADAALAGGIPGMPWAACDSDPPAEELDLFYQAWVDVLLTRTMRNVMEKLQAEGRVDYFRALFGRVCEGMSAAEIGQALDASVAAVENYLRVGKARLAAELRELVRQQVTRYAPPEKVAEQFELEWNELAAFLTKHGRLEEAIR